MPAVELDALTDDASEDLLGAPPAIDRLAAAHSGARVAEALALDAPPARLGRYLLLGAIAAGGMGVVHGAYDPELDRRVALKVVDPDERGSARARERLAGEARALARLDHPNVVKLHDVLVVDDDVVLVMELVAGQTLEAWERAAPRTLRELLAAYIEAGRGLAAAHALDIVHRDFKPANAVIGDDRRVRVLDFGLASVARAGGAAPAQPGGVGVAPATAGGAGPSSPPVLASASTGAATGELMGTLAYMAPEQLDGAAATAASDQFAFCVALYRAVYGRPPFAGADVAARLAAIRAGRLAPPLPGRRVPGWLRAALVRGLAADPAARHPSMAALLDVLGKVRGWRRWRTRVAIATPVAALAVVLVTSRRPVAAASCDDGGARLAERWSDAHGAAIDRALHAAGTPFAEELRPRIRADLDRYGIEWRQMRKQACVAHRAGEQSSELFDRRMLCLERRLGDLASAVDVLRRVDAASVAKAAEVVAGLPAIADCANEEALLAELDPPPVPLRPAIAALDARLSQAAALDRAGSADAPSVATAALADARALGYAPTVVEAGLSLGRTLISRDELDAAREPLAAAEELAFVTRQYAAGVEAAARRLYVEGRLGRDLDGLLRQAAVLEPISRGLRGDHFARPLLLNNVGTVHLARGDREPARAHFQAAHDALVGVEAPALELSVIGGNLAMLTPEPELRAALAESAWRRLSEALGAGHPQTLWRQLVWAHDTDDLAVARTRVIEVCALYRRFQPTLAVARAECEGFRAFLHEELGDTVAAAASWDEVVALTAGATDDDGRVWSRLAAGSARLARGESADALAILAPLADELTSGDAWWLRARGGAAALGAGVAAHALHRDREAIEHLESAVAAFTEATGLNEDMEYRRRLARARLALAEARATLVAPQRGKRSSGL